MKMKQLADRLGKHENTVRNWSRQFAEFLSPAPAKGEHRHFDDHDVRVLGYISKLSDTAMPYEDIRSALRRKVDEGSQFPPVLPVAAIEAPKGLITQAEMESRLALKEAEIEKLHGRVEELRRELDDLKGRYKEAEVEHRVQLRELAQEIGRLQARLEAARGDR
jgi:DNA-binding transcriptional MerR regulator